MADRFLHLVIWKIWQRWGLHPCPLMVVVWPGFGILPQALDCVILVPDLVSSQKICKMIWCKNIYIVIIFVCKSLNSGLNDFDKICTEKLVVIGLWAITWSKSVIKLIHKQGKKWNVAQSYKGLCCSGRGLVQCCLNLYGGGLDVMFCKY